MKRPAHMTLVDADKFSALVSRCTELRERAERAEARIEALEKEIDIGEVEGDIGAHRLHELRAALRGEEKER